MYEQERGDSFAGIVYILLLSRVLLPLERKHKNLKQLFLIFWFYTYTHTQKSYNLYMQLSTFNSTGKYQKVLKQLLDRLLSHWNATFLCSLWKSHMNE